MQNKNQSGNVIFNILLIVLLVVIAVLIYMLVGSNRAKIGDTVGIESPTYQTVSQPAERDDIFSDGLGTPQQSQQFQLDEFGSGIAERDTFSRDINGDGRLDRITRTRYENGTPHFYYEYKIELNNGNDFTDITPDGFRTTEGAECALQKLQFTFTPRFSVKKISRQWRDSWDTPTPAVCTIYELSDNALVQSDTEDLDSVCDVRELF